MRGVSEEELQQVSNHFVGIIKVLKSPMPSGSQCKDILLSIHLQAAYVMQLADENLETKRACPGLYWRKDKTVADKLSKANEPQEKRRKKMDTTMRCRSKGKADFSKNKCGPSRSIDDPGSRILCNKCYDAFCRDRKKNIV